jgi:mono/diheme cytochrome c family protein
MRIPTAGLSFAVVLSCVSFASLVKGQENNKRTSAPEAKQGSRYAELAKAPEKARAKHNPMETDPEAVAAGRNLFEQHCAECHGNDAQGGKKGPSLRVAEVQNAEPGAIFWVLTNGVVRKGMPVWSKLPEPQRWQLVSYIKSLGAAPAREESFPAPKSEWSKSTNRRNRQLGELFAR